MVFQILRVAQPGFMSWIKSVAHEENSKVLVFTETKRGADSLCRELQYQSLPANAIHGDKEQRQRDKTLHDFRTGRCNILIATDVAQRGLDIKDVAFVAGWYFAHIFTLLNPQDGMMIHDNHHFK